MATGPARVSHPLGGMAVMNAPRCHLNEIGRSQRGLVTRADLRAAGVSRSQRRRLEGEGTLRVIGRQTFELGGFPGDVRRALLAACLDVDGVASHSTAAWLHGLAGFAVGVPPEVMVIRRPSVSRSPLAKVHSTTWLPADDLTEVDGIPCTTVARTLFALAGSVPRVPLDQARGAVDDAIRTGRASDPWLWWRLEKLRCRGRRGVANFEAILSARAGGEVTESWLEREFLRILREARVDLPVCQARIEAAGAFVARVDFLYERLGIIVEVTGAIAHASPAQRASDARRRNRLGSAGYLVLEFTYEQVVGDPAAVVAEILAAMAARHARLAS